MKLKTKKRLRRLLLPFAFVWVCVFAAVVYLGALVVAFGFTMLGNPEHAKDLLKELF